MRHTFFMVANLLSIVFIGCGDLQQPSHQRPVRATDVSYTIIDSYTEPGIKRRLDIRLNRKISEETLRAIALKLKADDPTDYKRTFINYFLPDMAVGSGAWATTHFDPNLDVRILGLTAESEKLLTEEPAPFDHELIGRWLDERPFIASRITIIQQEGKFFLEQKFKDGSTLKDRVLEKPSSLGRRFDKAEGSSTGDHWILDAMGSLQIRDNEGLIATARMLK